MAETKTTNVISELIKAMKNNALKKKKRKITGLASLQKLGDAFVTKGPLSQTKG